MGVACRTARRPRIICDMKTATLCHLVRGIPPHHVLLGRKKRGFGCGKLVGYGGKLHPHESARQATSREIYEEACVLVRPDDLVPMGRITFRFPWRPEYDHDVVLFLASEWQGRIAETEEMAPLWVPVDDLPLEQMWDDDGYWLPRVLAGEAVDASFTFAEDNETVAEWNVKPVSGAPAEL